MKTLDVIVVLLLIIGGLNWGLVGFCNFNLIDTIFSGSPGISRLIYAIVGLCAVYKIFLWGAMRKRWR